MVSTEQASATRHEFSTVEAANAEAFARLDAADPWVVDVQDGRAAARQGSKWGFINRQGHWQ